LAQPEQNMSRNWSSDRATRRPTLGATQQEETMSRLGSQAIVLGGSVGGVVAARALADHFETVTVLERDTIPALGAQRKGVPQGRHAHGLLYAGSAAFEKLFPGWTELVVSHGGMRADPGKAGLWVHHGHRQARVEAPVDGLLASRPLLESTLRCCLLERSNVRFLENTDVAGVTTTADRSRVNGVRVRERFGSEERVLGADFVVDALGRGSASPRWLGELGYESPEIEEVRINLSYTTREFVRPASGFEGDLLVIVAAVPDNPRLAAMLALEGGRFVVTLGGCFGERAPEDLDGYRAYADNLPDPTIGRFLRQAQPLDEPRTGTFPASRRLRYERLRRFPAGYLIFADAIASFNPVFGQGLTVAALEGLILQECLAKGLSSIGRRFFRRASRTVDIPWSTAVLNDLRFPEVFGKRTAMVKFLHGYMPRVFARGVHDTVVARTVLDVVHMAKAPPALLSPGMLWRVYGPRRSPELGLPSASVAARRA
jgi:2-polyprenyl-6-methoxyphenol hydroxylase-like FAD-dependent oxidoreductase